MTVARFTWNVVPIAVSLTSFAVYVLMGHELTAATAFTSIALFNVLRFPLAMFPQVMICAYIYVYICLSVCLSVQAYIHTHIYQPHSRSHAQMISSTAEAVLSLERIRRFLETPEVTPLPPVR
jgi:hypothetical protein